MLEKLHACNGAHGAVGFRLPTHRRNGVSSADLEALRTELDTLRQTKHAQNSKPYVRSLDHWRISSALVPELKAVILALHTNRDDEGTRPVLEQRVKECLPTAAGATFATESFKDAAEGVTTELLASDSVFLAELEAAGVERNWEQWGRSLEPPRELNVGANTEENLIVELNRCVSIPHIHTSYLASYMGVR